MVGASGAIAGVLGAYLVLYPRATVAVVIPWLWFFGAFPLPAAFLIVFWFVLQLLNGVASLGTATGVTEGVAVGHVGGFITGLVLVWAFAAVAGTPRCGETDSPGWGMREDTAPFRCGRQPSLDRPSSPL
jgi:membrane associated rhomboid family serine protease